MATFMRTRVTNRRRRHRRRARTYTESVVSAAAAVRRGCPPRGACVSLSVMLGRVSVRVCVSYVAVHAAQTQAFCEQMSAENPQHL